MRDKATHHPKAGRKTSATAHEKHETPRPREVKQEQVIPGSTSVGPKARGTPRKKRHASIAVAKWQAVRQARNERENQDTQRRELSIGKVK